MALQVAFSSKTGRRRVHPNVPRSHPKVILSKEARDALKLDQREKTRRFRNDLDNAWSSLNKTTQSLASKHHKAIRHVQNELYFGHLKFHSRRNKINAWNAFCWKKRQHACSVHAHNGSNQNTAGKDTLPQQVMDTRMEYLRLSAEDKEQLIEQFTEVRKSKAVGVRTTMRSKVNDVSHTLKAIENELHNLQHRTGVETIVYATRGTTDLPLQSIAFTTEGVKDFMGAVMGVDTNDLVSKMKGFAVQGIKGAAQNHHQRVSSIRSSIRSIINCKLQTITRDSKAKMQWPYYFRNIVSHYRVAIEGWPDSITFANLSAISSLLSQLETLLRKWEMGVTYWKQLSEEEFEGLRQRRNEQLERGEITEPTRRARSDKGKKHTYQPSDSAQTREKHRSAPTVNSTTNNTPHSSPLPSRQQSLAPATPAAQTPTASSSTAANADPAETPATTEPNRQIATDSSINLTTGTARDNAEFEPSQTPTATEPDRQIATDSWANPTAGSPELGLEDLLQNLGDMISAFDGAAASQF